MVVGLVLVVVAAVAGSPDYAAWRPLLARELAAHAVTDPQDLYKFLHQGVMGPGHAGTDSSHLRAWLDHEWAELPAAADVSPRPPLLVPLRPDGRLVRVDLVRARDLAGDVRGLLAGVQALTVAGWRGDPQALAALWRTVVADTALWAGRLDPDSLAAFTAQVAAADWPAVHHGVRYRECWLPHYRVVDRTLLPPEWSP